LRPYYPIYNEKDSCVANFIVKAILPGIGENEYDIDVVFEILGDDSREFKEHLEVEDKSRPSKDCSSHDKGTLEYFQCVDNGNTHEAEHISIQKNISIFKN